MQGRTLQIKMVKDEAPKTTFERPKKPEEKPEAIVNDVIQQTIGGVVVGYTICKGVNFFFKVAEHYFIGE